MTSDDAPGVLAVQVPPDAPEAPAAEDDELPWPCLVRRTVGHFVPGYGGTGVNAPAAQAPAAEAERCGGGCSCGQCLPCVLPPGHQGMHDDGDRTDDHDAARAEVERLRGELDRTARLCAEAQGEATRAEAERDAARAEMVAAQDVASRRYGDIQDLRYELKDARAELARPRTPVWTRSLEKAVGGAVWTAFREELDEEECEEAGRAAVDAWLAALAQGAPPEGER